MRKMDKNRTNSQVPAGEMYTRIPEVSAAPTKIRTKPSAAIKRNIHGASKMEK
jgi:hypothetical protein